MVSAIYGSMKHASRHQNGGVDEISVTSLSGDLADTQDPKAHKTSHQNAGADEISVAGLSGALADIQPSKMVFSGVSDEYNNGAARYASLSSDGRGVFSQESFALGRIPAGTFKNLKFEVDVAPDTGKTVTCALRVDGATSALTCTISNSETEAEDVSNSVVVTDKQQVCLIFTPSGTPTVGKPSWYVEFDPT